jgi:TetR/AcrR family transcriptional repressor of bet genes
MYLATGPESVNTAKRANDETESHPEKQIRRAPKALRREQLINATIDSLALRGYAATTLADVADGAGLSRGIVNFHFESKEKLLIETLQFLADEYSANWREADAAAGGSAAARMRTLMVADLAERVCTPRQVAAWFAFFAEAKSRPAYQKLSWARDGDYYSLLVTLCEQLRREGKYAFETVRMADAVYAMQEGLWLRLMIETNSFDRATALDTSLAAIGTLFPLHFDRAGNIHETWKSEGASR